MSEEILVTSPRMRQLRRAGNGVREFWGETVSESFEGKRNHQMSEIIPILAFNPLERLTSYQQYDQPDRRQAVTEESRADVVRWQWATGSMDDERPFVHEGKRCQRVLGTVGNGVRGNSGDVSADWLSSLIHRISGNYQRQNGRNWVRLSNG